jgi:hypothetical protein
MRYHSVWNLNLTPVTSCAGMAEAPIMWQSLHFTCRELAALNLVGRSRNGGLGQIIIHPVIIRIYINAASGEWLVQIRILERSEGLDLVVGG